MQIILRTRSTATVYTSAKARLTSVAIPARRTASRRTCCRQITWTLCDRAKLTAIRVEIRKFSDTAPALNLPRLHLAPPFRMTPVDFCQDFRHQKTRVSGLSCGVFCVVLLLAVSVEHRLVTDGRTDGQTDRHTTTANTRAI